MGLILSRKQGERIVVDGACEIVVRRIEGGRVKLDFVGPAIVKRAELLVPPLVNQDGRKCVRRWWKMGAENSGNYSDGSLVTA